MITKRRFGLVFGAAVMVAVQAVPARAGTGWAPSWPIDKVECAYAYGLCAALSLPMNQPLPVGCDPGRTCPYLSVLAHAATWTTVGNRQTVGVTICIEQDLGIWGWDTIRCDGPFSAYADHVELDLGAEIWNCNRNYKFYSRHSPDFIQHPLEGIEFFAPCEVPPG